MLGAEVLLWQNFRYDAGLCQKFHFGESVESRRVGVLPLSFDTTGKTAAKFGSNNCLNCYSTLSNELLAWGAVDRDVPESCRGMLTEVLLHFGSAYEAAQKRIEEKGFRLCIEAGLEMEKDSLADSITDWPYANEKERQCDELNIN